MEKYIFIQKKDDGEFVSIIKVIEGQVVGDSQDIYIESEPMTEEQARNTFTVTDKFNELMEQAKEEL
jgi:hypothetical protein